MELYAYIVLFILVILFVGILPLLSGLASYKYEFRSNIRFNSKNNEVKSKTRKFKEIMSFTKEDTPIKFKLKSMGYNNSNKFNREGKTGLKRRVIGKFNDKLTDFDYDVDGLIKEELDQELEEERLKYLQFKGREQTINEELV